MSFKGWWRTLAFFGSLKKICQYLYIFRILGVVISIFIIIMNAYNGQELTKKMHFLAIFRFFKMAFYELSIYRKMRRTKFPASLRIKIRTFDS